MIEGRYARQTILPEIGQVGQRRLKDARVLVVGVGGLGSPAALYLAGAGVGSITIADGDGVDASNLHRQILYDEESVGQLKVEAAIARLRALNSDVEYHAMPCFVPGVQVDEFDVVIDGTDRFPARYAINEACVRAGRPNVHGAVYGFSGQISVFDGNRGPCYRCLFPVEPVDGSIKSCAEAGVVGPLPGLIGTLQALEAMKLILGIGEPLIGQLLLYDGLASQPRTLHFERDPHCPTCAGKLQNAATMFPMNDIEEMSPTELAAELAEGGRPVLLDVREADEIEVSHLPGIVHIPLGEVQDRASELDPQANTVVICRRGVRSAKAIRTLQELGFTRLRNLTGGMQQWAAQVEPTMPVA